MNTIGDFVEYAAMRGWIAVVGGSEPDGIVVIQIERRRDGRTLQVECRQPEDEPPVEIAALIGSAVVSAIGLMAEADGGAAEAGE